MRLTSGLRRARAAIGRHGLPALAAIAARALFGQGLARTVRLAAGDQPFLSVVSAPGPNKGPADRAWPPVLDDRGTVSAAAWSRWAGRARTRPRPPPPVSSAAPFAWVVDAASGSPADMIRTRQAIQALGEGLQLIETSDWVAETDAVYVFLRPGDAPDLAFVNAVREAAADGGAEIITFDWFRRRGDRVQPVLLPGANPALLAARDYIGSRAALRGSVVLETRHASAPEAILAWCAARTMTQARMGWRHIGRPLLDAAIEDRGPVAPAQSPSPRGRAPRVKKQEPASAVICTRDKGHLTRQLVRQLLAGTKDQLTEVVILSNGTTNPHALQTLTDLATDPRVRVIRDDAPFNFSRLCNRGVRETRGEGPLLFLNDDIAPVSEDWLGALSDQLSAPQTGAVGPLLLYPNETVQCAGIYLRFPSGVGHVLRGATLPQDDPLGLAAAAREVSCLTGAVLLTNRAAFHQVGGFDEALALSFQDVDYGLKLHQLGLRNVFEPRSVLIHMESVSLDNAGRDPAMLRQRHREKMLFMARWGSVFTADQFYPAGLDLDDESGRRLSRR